MKMTNPNDRRIQRIKEIMGDLYCGMLHIPKGDKYVESCFQGLYIKPDGNLYGVFPEDTLMLRLVHWSQVQEWQEILKEEVSELND